VVNRTTNLFAVGNPHAARSTFIEHMRPVIKHTGWGVLDLSSALQNGTFDVSNHQAMIESAEALTIHFPLYWYSAPALVKQWLDELLTPGWAFPLEQSKLKGKKLLLSVTTGAPLSSYARDGSNGIALEDVLVPFERTAHYCGMHWGGVVASQWPLGTSNANTDEEAVRAHLIRIQAKINAPA
jgi:putative NADPH-quinone reductase